jgi:molybdate transport system substrate-binding protein
MKLHLLTLLVFLFGGCQLNSIISSNGNSQTALTVSAAISLKDAFNEIGELYQSKTGRTVNFNFGASGALQKQLETGAPADIFASAGEKQMSELAAKELIDTATRRDFVRNTLVLIVPTDSKLSLTSFSDLTKAEVQKIAVGNPKTVPAGQYTEELFGKMNLRNSVQAKLILAENVRQVLDYVGRGETDAGIVYATDARIAGDRVRLVATADENTHSPILYPLGIVKDSQQKQAAKEFLDLVLSAEGQRILQKYGFAPVIRK